MANVHSFSALDIRKNEVPLAKYAGKVLLIVNVASKCGFTPQYKGLEGLQKEFGPRGFTVLGFPCNQFGGQEPGDEGEIQKFCDLTFQVSFPLFAKINVNGADTHPLYAYLKSRCPGMLGTESIKWNFTKFLVDKAGDARKRFGPRDEPASLGKEIDALLAEKS